MPYCIISAAVLLALSAEVFGWSQITHVYLGNNLIDSLALFAVGASHILLRYRKEFLLGNVIADMIVARKLSARRRESHSWRAAKRLLESNRLYKDPRYTAFVYGYLTHLAADTVAHNHFIPERLIESPASGLLTHLYWECRMDLIVLQKRAEVRLCHAKLIEELESSEYYRPILEAMFPSMLTFRFNRYIFVNINRVLATDGFYSLSSIYREKVLDDVSFEEDRAELYLTESVNRMIDIIVNKDKSLLWHDDPNGSESIRWAKRHRRLKGILV